MDTADGFGNEREVYPGVGFIVTNLTRPNRRVVEVYNGRGTAEQWVKEGKNALRWTQPSCHAFRHNAAPASRAGQPRQFPAHLGSIARGRALVTQRLREKLVKVRGPNRSPRLLRRVPAGRSGPRALFAEILSRIDRLRRRPFLT
jgi:hypothetical protein